MLISVLWTPVSHLCSQGSFRLVKLLPVFQLFINKCYYGNGKMESIILLSGKKLRLYKYKEGRKGLALFRTTPIWKFSLSTSGKWIFRINELSPMPRPFQHMAQCFMTLRTGRPYHAISPHGLLQK